ncbi:uncharacterized protein LOC110443352 isoform X2 [Mizuhopecten yessoensis]|uniref:uncharacterized protein LOC110443352 isoform X2 n=1 Tax=Mizuhopecten yessoensis TaxID=6573 RepID=UPI000B45E407|nr:uncharacterized protein LOC110443352 isoform X2 [Mizuhopecten yessoensis]
MKISRKYICRVCLAILLLIIGIKYTRTKDPTPVKVQVQQKGTTEKIDATAKESKIDTTAIEALPLKGYIVYYCDVEHPGSCGGWSDRMSGMFSVYVISVILRKHFLIKYTRSGDLTDFLVPNSFDWKYNSSILTGRTWEYHDLFAKVPNAIKKRTLTGLKNLFSKDVNFIRMNWDFTVNFRKFRGLQKVIPWLLELHFSDIYLKFFNTVFKPSNMITKAVNKVVQNVTKLACAHIRMGGSATIRGDDKHTDEKQLEHIWNALKTMEASNYSIFIATDADFVRERAKSLFNHLLEVEGRILHTDWGAKGEGLKGGYRKVVVDFFVLTKCDVLILTKSGFGIMSAYLNTKSSQMYCLTPNELVPCSRYTIHTYFPGDLLSPY